MLIRGQFGDQLPMRVEYQVLRLPDREGPTSGREQQAERFSDTHVFPSEGSVAALRVRVP